MEIFIQSRFSSKRLPGKALLPLAGIPMVILCARRAGNTGLPVTVLTSQDPSDDALCEALEQEHIPYFRGDLENVLERYFQATTHLTDDSTPLVRLTADNPFVDGALIQEGLRIQQDKNLHYLSLHPPSVTEVPYGLNLEVFTLKALREAQQQVTSHYDQEHTTPWMIRTYGHATFSPEALEENLAHLRCTVDTWTDYQKALTVFKEVGGSPIEASWMVLCEALKKHYSTKGVPRTQTPYGELSQLSLGGAQLGLAYGISNDSGKPSSDDVHSLLKGAVSSGVNLIDTAADYGDSEAILGQASAPYDSQLTIATKLSALSDLKKQASEAEIISAVEHSIYRSCHRLNTRKLSLLLLHRWEHHDEHSGLIWQTLRRLQAEGVISKLGASIQSPAEGLAALDCPELSFLQLPHNILDRRFQASPFLAKLKARTDLTVQARSVFLQGLLLTSEERWPHRTHYDASQIISQVDDFVTQFQREDVRDLSVAYVRAQPWIHTIVIGAQSEKQLTENSALFLKAPLEAEECAQIEAAFSNLPECLLNPALW